MGASINIITINAGSSSIKLALFALSPTNDNPRRKLDVSITGLGQSNSILHIQPTNEAGRHRTLTEGRDSAITALFDELLAVLGAEPVMAVGHRIVHGGPDFSQPQHITAAVEHELQRLAAFDPDHAPLALELINTARQRLVDIPQFACFDTAFFHDLPTVAQLLPLPRRYHARGLRRYGFHGLSYQYLQMAFRNLAGQSAVDGRVIYAHLGSGASLAATRGGRPVDTTMSMTPASGLVMSTRAGDIDPGIAWYLNQQEGVSLEDYNHMVNFESGLLGVSGLSADMYTLLQNETQNPHAAEAVEMFCYRTRQAIGGLAATLGGLDSLIFSGGIGEQSAVLRSRICSGLEFLGIQLDEPSNIAHSALISAPGSRIGIHIIPTDEARVIALQVANQLVSNRN